MSILASLARAYDRLPDAPPFGYSMQNIGVIVSLNEDGTVANVIDWRDGEGKKRKPRPIAMPQPVKRTAGIAPNFLWDKTSYVLGVTAGGGNRTAQEHAAFKERHEKALAGTNDAGLKALLLFLRQWTPEQFVEPLWSDELKDQNVIFVLESDRAQHRWLHARQSARDLWALIGTENAADGQACLVTGNRGPVARLHPAIKGVWGGQSSGGSIVSFNLDAFKSYEHEQGDNAPISEAAAFAYTTALNRFLERGSKHRIQIGDASTVFWADTSDMEVAGLTEGTFFAMFADPNEAASDEAESKKIGILLEGMRKGEQLEALEPKLSGGVRFHVLGIAPNAARLSIRFYFEDSFGVLAEHYQRFIDDMRIEPVWRDPYPSLWRYLQELAVLGKSENAPPNLVGEWIRSILSGTHYPLTLLSTVLSRIRADGNINALRISILRAVLVRNFGMKSNSGDKCREAPVALDLENRNKGYLLGRLFAAYERAQTMALGDKVNSTIKDKFYGSASATPRNVFALLDRGSHNHLAKVGKKSPGQRINLERLIGSIMEAMSPENDPFPASLGATEQAMFGLGYYHQRGEFFRKRETTGTEEAA